MRKKNLLLLGILLVAAFSFLILFNIREIGLNVNNPTPLLLEKRDPPFSITSNGQFSTYASGGNGNPGTPWIIQGYNIVTSSGTGIYIAGTTDHFVIKGCSVTTSYSSSSGRAIYFNNVDNGNITDCNIYSSYYGVYFYYAVNCYVVDNTITSNRYNLYIQYSNYVDIILNQANYASTYNLYLYDSEQADIYNNSFCYASSSDGVYINSYCHYADIYYNTICSNGDDGIHVYYSNNVDIISNTINSNNDDGVYISSSCDYAIMDHNVINSNGGYGIYIYSSSCDHDQITYNTLHYNDDGGYKDYGTSTIIYGNSILDNIWPDWPFSDADTAILIGIGVIFGVVIAICVVGSVINRKYQDGKRSKPTTKKTYTPAPKYQRKTYRSISDIIADMESGTPTTLPTTPAPKPTFPTSKPIMQAQPEPVGDYVIVNKVRVFVQKTKLDLSGRGIKNISEIIGLNRLNYLEELDLSDNEIVDIEGLHYLTNLTYLNLYKNHIIKISGLDSLINLEYLYLSNNYIAEIEGLEYLEKLEMLTLAKNQIQEIKGLDNIINLRHLNLRNNKIKFIRGLENLINLKRIWLQENPINQAEMHFINAPTSNIVEYCKRKSLPKPIPVISEEEEIPIEIDTRVASIFDSGIEASIDRAARTRSIFDEIDRVTGRMDMSKERKYRQTIEHEKEPEYQPEIKYEKEPEYQPEIKYKKEPEYQPDIEYEEEPEYMNKIAYEEEPDYLNKINYEKEPEYIDKIDYQEPKYENEIDFDNYEYESRRVKKTMVQEKLDRIDPEELSGLTESYLKSLSLSNHEDILNELQSDVSKAKMFSDPLNPHEIGYKSALPESNFGVAGKREGSILPESNFGVVGKLEGSLLEESDFGVAEKIEETSHDELFDIQEDPRVKSTLLSEENPLNERIIPSIELEFSPKILISDNVVGSAFDIEVKDGLNDLLKEKEFESQLISEQSFDIDHEIPELVMESHVPEISSLNNTKTFDDHAQRELNDLSEILNTPTSSFDNLSGIKFEKLDTMSSESFTSREIESDYIEARRQADQRRDEVHARQESFRTTAEQAKNIYVYYNGEKIEVKNNVLHLRRRGITSLRQIRGLEELRNLEELNLYQNDITSITGLEKLRKLKKLNLGANKLSYISGLEYLGNLEVLLLDNNNIRRISGLDKLIYLKKLDLRGNKIRKIEGLKELKDLEELNLSDNEIRQIEGIRHLINLETFICDKNPINDKEKQMLLQSAQRIVDYCQRKESKARVY